MKHGKVQLVNDHSKRIMSEKRKEGEFHQRLYNDYSNRKVKEKLQQIQ